MCSRLAFLVYLLFVLCQNPSRGSDKLLVHEPRHVCLEFFKLDFSITVGVDFVSDLGPSLIVYLADAIAKYLTQVIRINLSILIEI